SVPHCAYLSPSPSVFYAPAPHLAPSLSLHDALPIFVQSFHGAKQRSFLIQGFTIVGTKGSRNIERAILDKSRGSRVPGGISSCLEGGTQAAGREAGCIRFSFDQFFPGKLHDDLSAAHRGNKAVMFFRCKSGHRLEPVGKMGCAVLD